MSELQKYARPFSAVLQDLVEAHERELRESRSSFQQHVESRDVPKDPSLRDHIVRAPNVAWTSVVPMAPTDFPGVLHQDPGCLSSSVGGISQAVPTPCKSFATTAEATPPSKIVEGNHLEANKPDSKADTKRKTSRFHLADPALTPEEEEEIIKGLVKEALAAADEETEALGLFAPLKQPCMRLAEWWSTLEEPERRGPIAEIALSTRCSLFCTFIILLNSFYTYFETNQGMDDQTYGATTTHRVIEVLFISFYMGELLLKLYVHRLYFFCNSEMTWNIFDFLLVMQGLLDVIMMFFQVEVMKATFGRLLRILKLGKIFRVFRAIRFLRDLRVLMSSIVSSVAALMWSLVLLALCLYMVSIAFVQMLTGFLVDSGEDVTDKLLLDIDYFFGSVLRGMKTLFMCTSGGVDWIEVEVVVSKAGWAGEAFLLGFLLFWHFSIINIITGIVMEKAVRNAQPDRDTIMMEQRFQRSVDAKALKQIFHDLDDDNSGTVNELEFNAKLEDKKVVAYLASLDLNVTDIKRFFSMLVAAAGTDEIGIESFVDHCMQMKGYATALDLNVMMFQVQAISANLEGVIDSVNRMRDEVKTTMGQHFTEPYTSHHD